MFMADIKFDKIEIGGLYSATELAEIWGYKSHHALIKGIVVPTGSNIIILFVTREKQTGATPYIDEIFGNILHMMGQEKHGTDKRLNDNLCNNKDEIHLFYRERHHTPFIYYGRVFLIESELFDDKPSQFKFLIQNLNEDIENEEFLIDYIVNFPQERNASLLAEGVSKISRHVRYERNPKNREEAIRIQGTRCKICGFDFNAVYGKSLADNYIEVHHIKLLSEGEQVPDPAKDLIPVCANCHRILHRRKKNNISIDDLINTESLKKYREIIAKI